jgi:hypothetical protein
MYPAVNSFKLRRPQNHMMLTNPDRFDKTFTQRNSPLNWDN